MTDLERELARGPLRVESLFRPERAADFARRALGQRRRRALRVALLTASACLVLGGLLAWPEASVPSAATTAPSSSRAPAILHFADGSRAEPHDLASSVVAEEENRRRVRVRLKGGAHFDVTPNPTRTFEVHTQRVVIRVLGTAFSIDPQGARTRVRVERGLVEVRWGDGSALLSAGEVGLFPRAPRTQLMRTLTPADAKQAQPTPAEHPPGAESPPERRSVAARAARARASQAGELATRRASITWRHAAEAGDYRRAYTELTRNKPADDPSELLLAADVARQSAHPEAAVALLRRLCARFPHDKRTPVAAFTLGRVLRDDLKLPADAALAFEQASATWPEGPLAEQALARAVEAYSELGDRARARELATRALERFPGGRHADAMREALAR